MSVPVETIVSLHALLRRSLASFYLVSSSATSSNNELRFFLGFQFVRSPPESALRASNLHAAFSSFSFSFSYLYSFLADYSFSWIPLFWHFWNFFWNLSGVYGLLEWLTASLLRGILSPRFMGSRRILRNVFRSIVLRNAREVERPTCLATGLG